jgi:hypothetical protein
VFILPNPPSPQADVQELADFAELLCLQQGATSAREIIAYLGRVDDNANNIGAVDDDDDNADMLDEVMDETDIRSKACGDGYPFVLEQSGTRLRHADAADNPKSIIYRYLLLSTRLNMRDSRKHADIDGGDLLEELAAHVLRNYLGRDKARTMVFGTAAGGRFQDRVDLLCRELREGVRFRSLDLAPVNANDDKLDAVGWVPFVDGRPGQLILFGQCKTGSNWGGLVTQLQPESFIKKWMLEPYLVNPVRVFFLSEAVDQTRWKGICTETGILLDRCRIVEFSDQIEVGLLDRISRWTDAARNVAVPRRASPRRVARRVRRSS